MLVPSIMEAPPSLCARQWKKVRDLGHNLIPPLYLTCGLSLGYLAYRRKLPAWCVSVALLTEWYFLEPVSSTAFKLYATAAALVPSIIPYTRLVITPLDHKLIDKAYTLAYTSLEDKEVEADVPKEERVHELMKKWAGLHAVRALMAGVAAVCAAWASLNPVEVVGLEHIALVSGADRLG